MADDASPEDFVQSLPPAVQSRVQQLKVLQSKYDDLEGDFQKEVEALEAKYAALYEPLLEQRAGIVSGETSAPDEPADKDQDSTKGIPNFWLRVLQTHPELSEQISEKDAAILEHLIDIREEPRKDESGEEQAGFQLIFKFRSQPYFTNSELVKTYIMADDEKEMLEKAEGTTINWNQGKNPAFKLMRRKASARGRGRGTTQTKLEPVASFFNFFSPPPVPSASQEVDEDDLETLQAVLSADYELGDALRDVIPNAVTWYTGEALEGDDDDEEDDDEEDEDDDEEEDEDDEDDDDDDDEEEDDGDDDEEIEEVDATKSPANGRKRQSAGKSGKVPEDTGEKPQECKQQ